MRHNERVYPDVTSHEAAGRLASHIRNFWHSRGFHEVVVTIAPVRDVKSNHLGTNSIITNLVNGLPPSLVGGSKPVTGKIVAALTKRDLIA